MEDDNLPHYLASHRYHTRSETYMHIITDILYIVPARIVQFCVYYIYSLPGIIFFHLFIVYWIPGTFLFMCSCFTGASALLLTPLEPQSPLGTKLLEIWLVCPQNGTAVLKGLKYIKRTRGRYQTVRTWRLVQFIHNTLPVAASLSIIFIVR